MRYVLLVELVTFLNERFLCCVMVCVCVCVYIYIYIYIYIGTFVPSCMALYSKGTQYSKQR